MLTVLNSSNDPFYNLAFEEYVYQNFREDDVFLLWRNAPCVVAGRYQNICAEVKVSARGARAYRCCGAPPAAARSITIWAT